MKTIILVLSLISVQAFAVEGETYAKEKISNDFSKLEAMRILLTTDNKATVYKCVLVELSNKGTIKNK